jgi:malonyl-CoA O-methyltransferase
MIRDLEATVRAELIERLSLLAFAPARILALEASGESARALKRRYRAAEVISLADAPARSRWPFRTHPLIGRAGALPLAAASVDLIVACLPAESALRTSELLAEALRVLRPRGYLSFAVLGAGTLAELREARAAFPPLPDPLPLARAPELSAALQSSGFVDVVLDVDRRPLRYESLRSLLADTRALRARGSRPLPYPRARELAATLRGRLADGRGGLVLPVELLFGQGFAPTGGPARRWRRDEVVIGIGDIRRR